MDLTSCAVRAAIMGCLFLVCVAAQADDRYVDAVRPPRQNELVMATTGSSGLLNSPDARTLEGGTAVFGFNNFLDLDHFRYERAENYQFGIGLFRYLELSGRLANYPLDTSGTLGLRDLSANIKVSLPKIFSGQPDIAFGVNDVGGGASNFSSKYLVVGEEAGPLRVNVGLSSGKPYLGAKFGSVALAIGRGISVIADRSGGAYFGGVRYASRPIASIGNARITASVQRSFGARAPDGGRLHSSAFGIQLALPFGQSEVRQKRRATEFEPIWTPPSGYSNVMGGDENGQIAGGNVNGVAPAMVSRDNVEDETRRALETVQRELVRIGMERIRVGIDGQSLVVEFENHRYNQNEVDAVGIVLGVAATYSPRSVTRVVAVAKKAGLALYEISVGHTDYQQFLRNGESFDLKSTFAFRMRPPQHGVTNWLNSTETAAGFSRVRIEPSLKKFVGTEWGVFDYSLAANLQMMVPIWKGAELNANVVHSLAESDNVRGNGIFGYAQQRGGLSSAVVSQSFWLSDQILSVTSVGKLRYDDLGLQQEATYFLPGRDDQVRFHYTHLRHPDFLGNQRVNAGGLSYQWSYQPLDVAFEASYNRYVAGDKGPTFQFNRWFGDVQAQVFMRRSNVETKIGFGLAFPLTPREGMRPGWTHFEGAGSYAQRLETKLARSGQCNCITNGIVQEMPLVYSARSNLLNQGRIGRDYFVSQLQRMREAALMYASLAP